MLIPCIREKEKIKSIPTKEKGIEVPRAKNHKQGSEVG
jgi:ribosomal protein S30